MRVLHLTGSAESDFFCDLSRLYAGDCLEATAGTHEALIAHVTPDGAWRFPSALDDAAIGAAAPMDLAAAIAHVVSLAPDLMLPQMFCRPGMTHYRALFDVLRIGYVGNRPDVMALTADKARAKAVVGAAEVAVPRGEVVRAGGTPSVAVPAVVKPVDADNSSGVTFVESADALPGAVAAALEHSDGALVEEYVPLGREVRCGVLVRDGVPVVLPLEEYAVDHVRRLDDKLARSDGALRLVAKDSPTAWIVEADDPIVGAVGEAALACHEALGCRHYGLFDFRVDPDGTPWFLEAGLYCSFARQSVIAVMARAAGIDAGELLSISLTEAKRHP